MKSLLAEFDLKMELAGYNYVDEVRRDSISQSSPSMIHQHFFFRAITDGFTVSVRNSGGCKSDRGKIVPLMVNGSTIVLQSAI